MIPDFDKAREWRLAQWACAILTIAYCMIGMLRLVISLDSRFCAYPTSLATLATAICASKVQKYSRCPHCGKSVFTKWLGRDGAGRNAIKRIEKRLPIICPHCGEELETA